MELIIFVPPIDRKPPDTTIAVVGSSTGASPNDIGCERLFAMLLVK